MNRARNKLTREAGFTLVELLVVIMIVAVLAAIAIPAFFEQRDKARDAQTKQGLATARTAIELVRHEKRTYV
jgi:prepilin-type N-terminal cleavage/methylation domain-containing protein